MGRYELSDFEWTAIEPHLPNKPRGVPRVDDRRVLNGIFWVLRSGTPWAGALWPIDDDLQIPSRWRKAGVWDRLMDAITKAYDGDVQMIDTSVVRVHQQGATGKGGSRSLSRSLAGRAHHQKPCPRHAQGRPIQLKLTAGQASDIAAELTGHLAPGAMLLADKGYDANALRALVGQRGA